MSSGFKDDGRLFRGKRKLLENWREKAADDFRFEEKISE